MPYFMNGAIARKQRRRKMIEGLSEQEKDKIAQKSNEEERQKALNRPLEDLVFDLKADYEKRLIKEGVRFSQGLNAINMGDISDTKENRAKVALGWIGAMIAMDYPEENATQEEL